MVAALRGVVANLAAGLRLALLLPVGRHAFRFEGAQLVLLALVSALVDIGVDWLRSGPEATFAFAGIGGELAALAILLLLAALLAWFLADDALGMALPIVVLAAMPIVQLANAAPGLLLYDEARPAWVTGTLRTGLLLWFLLVLGRSTYVALAPHAFRPLRAVLGGAALAAPLLIPAGVLPETPWWMAADSMALDPHNPAAEPVLTLQRELQDEALAALSEHAQGETDLYFVAFAPDGGAAWPEHLASARRTMDLHWGTEGRSLVYVNDATHLTQAPMASVTHLREALEEIAAVSDPDEDIVMLYLAGRSNADGSMLVDLPPLGLVQLSGSGLASLLRQAGLRWRVVIVASCAPQAFVDALVDAQTLVFAAAADRSAHCAAGRDPAAFGEIVFDGALASAATIPAALAQAHKRLAAKHAEPTIHVGAEIASQLARVRSAQGNRAAAGARSDG